ncbi:MAG: hypothetical protein QOE58_1830 [Actinomycetota bacterium]|nr:hypothetical protein [Actinomycetota bacterium]
MRRPFRYRAWAQIVGFGAVLATTAGIGLAPVSLADTATDKKKVDADIAQLRTALEDTTQVLATAFVELHRTRAELPGAQRSLAAATAATLVADRHNDEVTTALAVARANEAKAAAALARNARAKEGVTVQLGNLVRDDYQHGGISGLSIALEATSPEDFTNRLLMMDTVMRVRGATLRSLDAMRAQGQAGQSHLVAVGRQVAELKVQAEAALARTVVAREAAAAAKAKLDRLYAAQTRYATTVAAKKATEISSIKNMKAESDSLARVLAARARAAREAAARAAREAHRPVPQSVPNVRHTGFLSYPSNAPVSSEFGMRFHPIWKRFILHQGIDFAAGCGSPVVAAADGDVILATPVSGSGGYGNRLVIDHGLIRGSDLTTTYNHLTSFVVTSGHVSRGQLVAYSGTTGSSTGCHLHFETRQDGTPVNPRSWL